MSKLILVKHSLPQIDPAVPAAQWLLATEGQRRSHFLAQQLVSYQPARVFSSPEPKAYETAQLIVQTWDVQTDVVDGLEEHHRSSVGYLGQEEFRSAVQNFFAKPHERVFGEETAQEAYHRFQSAITHILKEETTDVRIVVAHGTVITLFVCAHNSGDAFGFWQKLGLPSYVVLDYPSYQVTTMVEHIAER